MSSRPELKAPPEIFYDDEEARKYTSSSRIVKIQSELTKRALELLALPEDGVPRLLLDNGCGSGLSGETLSENGNEWIGLDISASMLNVALEREVEGDLLLGDMGQGFGMEDVRNKNDIFAVEYENGSVLNRNCIKLCQFCML